MQVRLTHFYLIYSFLFELLFIVQILITNIGISGGASKEINFALRIPQFAVQTTLQIITSKDLCDKFDRGSLDRISLDRIS
jgi:hypothetical protein